MSSSDLPADMLSSRIQRIRNVRVMLSSELADLYAVEHRVLMQAVSRNLDRFPVDFMFRLSADEWANLKSNSVTSSWGGIRKLPHAFTDQGGHAVQCAAQRRAVSGS